MSNIVPVSSGETRACNGRFEQTQWTIILRARAEGADGAREAMDRFAGAYWQPLYQFIRREGYGPQDAEDLTQGFYQHLLQKQLLNGVGERTGRFRNYLLTCLKHFLSDERDRAEALKRGGGKTIFSRDALEAEEREAVEPSDCLTPDQIFERRWAQAILLRGHEALREKYVARGKGALFQALQNLTLGGRTEASYAEIARQHGMTEQGVKSAANQLRQQFFKVVRREIERTVNDPRETDDEIRYLISVLAR